MHGRVLSLLDPLCVLVPPPAAGGIGALSCVAGCDCSAASNTCIAKQDAAVIFRFWVKNHGAKRGANATVKTRLSPPL